MVLNRVLYTSHERQADSNFCHDIASGWSGHRMASDLDQEFTAAIVDIILPTNTCSGASWFSHTAGAACSVARDEGIFLITGLGATEFTRLDGERLMEAMEVG